MEYKTVAIAMQDQSDIFDAYLPLRIGKRLIGPFQPGSPLDITNKRAEFWIDGLHRHPNLIRPCPIYFALQECASVKARAAFSEDLGLVTLSRGASEIPMNLFATIMTHPETLPQIGCVKHSTISPQHRVGIHKDIIDWSLALNKAFEGKPSKWMTERRRGLFGEIAIRIWNDFLLHHEFAHIVRGHIGYKHATFGISEILEFAPDELADATFQADMRAAEFDADFAAAWQSLAPFLVAIQKGKYRAFGNQYEFLSDESGGLFIWSFAICCLFLTWGMSAEYAHQWKQTHLPVALRFHITGFAADGAVQQLCPHLMSRVPEIVNSAWDHAMRCLQLLGAEGLNDQAEQGRYKCTKSWAY